MEDGRGGCQYRKSERASHSTTQIRRTPDVETVGPTSRRPADGWAEGLSQLLRKRSGGSGGTKLWFRFGTILGFALSWLSTHAGLG
jgi:hypothetical protein